jgi:hypothetical protein
MSDSILLPALRRIRREHAAVVAVLVGVFLLVNFLPLWHTDIWGHLKFGQWITDNRRLPAHEPFCAAADKSAPYVNFQWLSQVGFYLVYHLGERLAGGDDLERTAGGVELLRMLHAALITLRSALMIIALKRWTGSWKWSCAGACMSLALGIANVGVLRPQVAAEVLFAALLVLLSNSPLSGWSIGAIAGIMVIWTNTHGSYPVGLMLLGGWSAGLLVENRFGWSRNAAATMQTRRLLLACGLSVLGIAFLNPHGPALFLHTLALAQHPNIADMDEWKKIAFGTPWGVAFAASFVPLFALPLLRRFVMRPVRASGGPSLVPQFLLLVGFGVETFVHQRFMPWWALLVPWVLASWWGNADRCEAAAVEDVCAASENGIVPKPALLCGVLLFAGWSLAGAGQWLREGRPRDLEGAVHSATPWRLADEIKSEYAAGRWHGAIFATETLGDYLLWALPPEVPVLLYTHVHLFSPEHWRQCQRVKAGAPDWCTILDAQQVRLVLCEVELHSRLCDRIRADSDWRVLLDESGERTKPDIKGRIFIAARAVEP